MPEYARQGTPVEPLGREPQYATSGTPLGGGAMASEGHPVLPPYVPDTDDRVRKYGGIKSEPQKSWTGKVLDFAAELVPYHQYMSNEGRQLMAAMPQEARSQKNFMEFTKALDWMIGGDEVVSFAARKIVRNHSLSMETRDVIKNIMTNAEDRIGTAQTKNQKYIDELFDDLTHPKDLTAAQRNQKIIDQTFGDSTKRTLPLRHAQPVDRVRALQEANQKIINSTNIDVPYSQMDDIQYFHSGYPLREGWQQTKQLVQDTVGRFWWKPEVAKDLKLREKIIGLPHWIAKKYPQAKKLYEVQMARENARSELTHQFLDGIDGFLKLKGKDYDEVKRVLMLGDKEGKVFQRPELAKAGMSNKAIDAYEQVRSTLDTIQGDYWKRMKQAGVPDAEIEKLRRNVGNINGYFPRVRKGKYFVRAEKEGAPPQRIHFNNGIAGKKIRNRLEREGYRIVDEGKVSKLPEEVYFQISPEAISQVIDTASHKFDDAIQKELKQNVANIFKERGWGQHGITRQDFIEGFETDNLKNVLFEYINGYSGYVTKMDAAKKFRETLVDMAFKGEKAGGIRAVESPKLYAWSEDYVRDVMANADIVDKISGVIRAASFFKYLGAVIKTGIVNHTQNFIAAAPRLSLETKWAYPKLTKAMEEIVEHYAPKGRRLIPEEQKALRIALQKKWGEEQYVKELMGNLSKFGRVPGAVQKFMGGPMAIGERFNRQSTFLAAYRVFRNEKKLGFEKAIEKAGEIVEDSHFVYGKGNLPSLFRGTTTGKIARAGYTFRTFTHNYINLLSYLGRKDKKAVAKSLAAITALGGVSALPLAKTFESVAQSFGYQPRQWFKEKLNEYGLGGSEELALYGLPALADIDLGGSIGIEVPGQQSLTSEDPKAMLYEGATDFLGVPFSYVDDTIKASQHLYRGDIYRAIEDSPITPVVVSNAMAAKRIATEGQTTSSGKAILTDEGEPIKYTTGQAIKKGVFGFQPVESSKRYQQYKSRKAASTFWNKKRDIILSKYRRMVNRYGFGSDEADKVLDEMEEYNLKRPEFASEITSGTIKERLTDKLTKKEQILREQIK